jgi:DNA-binding beta-propeller fold protein YncE
VLTTIPVGIVPDGIAVNPFTNRIYTPNSVTNDVSVIQG